MQLKVDALDEGVRERPAELDLRRIRQGTDVRASYDASGGQPKATRIDITAAGPSESPPPQK